MYERRVFFWKRNGSTSSVSENNEVGPNDITTPLPEVFAYERIVSMLGNISDNYPLENNLSSVELLSSKLPTKVFNLLRLRKSANAVIFRLMFDRENWLLDLVGEKRKVGFKVDTMQKKIEGQLFIIDGHAWVKQEDLKSPSILLVPILMDIEKGIFFE